jgi:hypothetical protein
VVVRCLDMGLFGGMRETWWVQGLVYMLIEAIGGRTKVASAADTDSGM